MLKWLSNIIGAIVDTAVEFVDDVINAVGEFVADLFDTIGNLINDGLSWLGSLLPGKWSIIFTWPGNIISSLFTFAGSVLKGLLNIVGNVITGAVRILFGLLTLNGPLILEGLNDFAEIGGNLIVILGRLLELIHSIFIPWQVKRRLTPAEASMLARIYRGSLALYNIRIVENAAGFYGLNDIPFVMGNVIYLKGINVNPNDPLAKDHILVHESIHVWQYQIEGGGYITSALGAEAFDSDTNRLHGWRVEFEVNDHFRFRDFNKEAQGWFLEDIYRYGELLPGKPPAIDNGVFFDADGVTTFGQLIGIFPRPPLPTPTVGHGYTELARDGVDYIRGKLNFRLSRLLP